MEKPNVSPCVLEAAVKGKNLFPGGSRLCPLKVADTFFTSKEKRCKISGLVKGYEQMENMREKSGKVKEPKRM